MVRRYQLENLVPLLFSIISGLVIYYYYANSVSDYLGSLLCLFGLLLWWWGKLSLGDAFGSLIKPKKLVKIGIYRKIRHPIYLGLVLVLWG